MAQLALCVLPDQNLRLPLLCICILAGWSVNAKRPFNQIINSDWNIPGPARLCDGDPISRLPLNLFRLIVHMQTQTTIKQIAWWVEWGKYANAVLSSKLLVQAVQASLWTSRCFSSWIICFTVQEQVRSSREERYIQVYRLYPKFLVGWVKWFNNKIIFKCHKWWWGESALYISSSALL